MQLTVSRHSGTDRAPCHAVKFRNAPGMSPQECSEACGGDHALPGSSTAQGRPPPGGQGPPCPHAVSPGLALRGLGTRAGSPDRGGAATQEPDSEVQRSHVCDGRKEPEPRGRRPFIPRGRGGQGGHSPCTTPGTRALVVHTQGPSRPEPCRVGANPARSLHRAGSVW